MDSVTMPALKWAAKLKAKLKTLKAARPKELAYYKADCAAWRIAMKTWISKHGTKRVEEINDSELKSSEDRYRRNDGVDFNHSAFFKDAPKTPKYPAMTEKRIGQIQAALRGLAITGQKTVRVDDEMIKKFFGDEEVEE